VSRGRDDITDEDEIEDDLKKGRRHRRDHRHESGRSGGSGGGGGERGGGRRRRFKATLLRGERGISIEFGKFVALISISGEKEKVTL
jgi:hypothetical protein